MKVSIAKLNVAARTQAEIDGIENRRLAAVAWSDEAIDSRRRTPLQVLYTPKILNLDYSYPRHFLSALFYFNY